MAGFFTHMQPFFKRLEALDEDQVPEQCLIIADFCDRELGMDGSGWRALGALRRVPRDYRYQWRRGHNTVTESVCLWRGSEVGTISTEYGELILDAAWWLSIARLSPRGGTSLLGEIEFRDRLQAMFFAAEAFVSLPVQVQRDILSRGATSE